MARSERAKENARLRARSWRKKNAERHREYQRKYRSEHAEQCYQRNREWALANPELVNEYHRRSRRNNPDKYRETTRRYRRSHPGVNATNSATRRARRRGAPGHLTLTEWREIVAAFGGHCARCGHTGGMTKDHIVPLSRGGTHTKDNIQPLCVSCNSQKHTQIIDYRLTSPHYQRSFE